MASLDSPDVSIFSPASPEVKIRGKTTRKFKKERIREAANLFVRNEEERKSVEPVEEEDDDDSLSFKHGKDNTFDRLCAKDRGKNGEGNVARGRVSSPFTPVDDDSKAVAPPGNIWRPRRLPLRRFFPGLSTITDLKIMVGRLQNLDREPKLPNI